MNLNLDYFNQEEIIKRLKNKLEEFNIDFDKFNKNLIENNAFLSGSFLLQIIMNENFKIKGDMDIYKISSNRDKIFERDLYFLFNNAIEKKIQNELKKDETEIFFRYKDSNNPDKKLNEKEKENFTVDFKKNKLKIKIDDEEFYSNESHNSYYGNSFELYDVLFKKRNDGICSNFSYRKYSLLYYSNYEYLENIDHIINLKTKFPVVTNLQLIYYSDSVKSFNEIVDNFDFDFCSNYWDGSTLYIKNSQSIKESKCIWKLSNLYIGQKHWERIEKYSIRKFEIKICYEGELYDIILNNSIVHKFLPNIIVYNIILLDKFIKELDLIEKIIILDRDPNYLKINFFNNIPFTIKSIKIYCSSWLYNSKYNIGDYKNNEKQFKYIEPLKKILKLPFGCKLIFNQYNLI